MDDVSPWCSGISGGDGDGVVGCALGIECAVDDDVGASGSAVGCHAVNDDNGAGLNGECVGGVTMTLPVI